MSLTLTPCTISIAHANMYVVRYNFDSRSLDLLDKFYFSQLKRDLTRKIELLDAKYDE